MSVFHPTCSICSADADWIRVRKPNAAQMDYLCHRHYQFLLERNPLMASWYDNIVSVAPMDLGERQTAGEDPGRLRKI